MQGVEYIKTAWGWETVSSLVHKLEDKESEYERMKADYYAAENRFAWSDKYNGKMNDLQASIRVLTKALKKPTYRLESGKYIKNGISKNPKPSLATCKKILAESENDNYTPTISHYRDNKNGMKARFKITDKKAKYVFYSDNVGQARELLKDKNFTVECLTDEAKKMLTKKNPKDAYNKVDALQKRLFKGTITISNYELALHRLLNKGEISESEYKTLINNTSKLRRNTQNPKFIYSNDRFTPESKRTVIKDNINKKIIIPDNKSMLSVVRENISTGQIIEAVWKGKTYIWTLGKNGTLSKLLKVGNGKSSTQLYKDLRELGYSHEKALRGENYWQSQPLSFRNSFKGQGLTKRKNIINFVTDNQYVWDSAIYNVKPNFTNADFNTFKKQRLNDLSEMFQGEVKGTRARVLQSDIAPKDGSLLGQLVQMKVKRNGKTVILDFDGESLLTMDLRKNLWAKGKDAKLNGLSSIGIRKPTKGNLSIIGDLIQIDYVTAKRHIENGQLTRFWHPLGEVNKEYPKLAVDYDGFPVILGGGYDIWNVGIVN